MNQDYEKELEAEIDQELKRLPDLQVPPALMTRVMRVIENRASLPWYRCSWQVWPRSMQVASLIVLLALFGGLCFAAWKLPQVPQVASATHRANGWISGLSVVWNVVNVILGAIVIAVKRLGTGFIIGCCTALAMGWAMCVGLGTLYLRIGFARRERT